MLKGAILTSIQLLHQAGLPEKIIVQKELLSFSLPNLLYLTSGEYLEYFVAIERMGRGNRFCQTCFTDTRRPCHNTSTSVPKNAVDFSHCVACDKVLQLFHNAFVEKLLTRVDCVVQYSLQSCDV
ncbi:hypothetical protein ASF76_10285 [Microbacterium sp. Leaf151]|nr:hypothetical protein ASF76_10285 [Microbacterium sp. Leaf151]